MKTRARLLALPAVLALGAAWLAHPALPTFADNSLTTTNMSITWTHGPFVVPNPTDQVGPPNCTAPQSCDIVPFTVSVPSGTNTTDQITITLKYDQSTDSLVDFDLWVLNSAGTVIASNTSGVSPTSTTIPAVSGSYTIEVDPWFPGGESYSGSVDLTPLPTASSAPPPDAATQGTGLNPRYQNYEAPTSVGGTTAGEPSIGYNPNTGNVLVSSDLQTLKVHFDDTVSPARASWTDVSSLTTSKESLDPILVTDRLTGRTFVSQLTGQDSLTAYTDNDGYTWTPSQGGGIPSGVDHQTIGIGPYSSSVPLPTPNAGLINGFHEAVYYCSQDIATAFCARSDDGGLTFNVGVPIDNITECAGIHGHVKIAPDGTVYVPLRSCGGMQGVAVSTDNGTTWAVRTIPGSTAAIGNDPSVGIGSDGTVYEGWQGSDGHARIAVTHDRGLTWTTPVDVGYLAGVQGMVFPAVVAGDPGRAAFAYLGTTTGGNFQSQPNFNGVWYLYISTTYDGGKTWTTVNATPNDPVQRGSICISGTTCSNTPDDRNLLDFIDATMDSQGRVLVAYADGCVGACVSGTGTYNPGNTAQSQQSQLNSFTAINGIARQSGGRSLLAKYDTTEPKAPARPSLTATQASSGGPVTLSWAAPDNGGSPITAYKVYRGTAPGTETLLTNVGTHLSYVDSRVHAGTTYYYELVAVNKVGSSPLSPEVTPSVVNAKPECTLPGQQVLDDPTGDQTGAPNNPDLDITGVYVAQPRGMASQLAITVQVADLSNLLSASSTGHQWRAFWDADSTGDRWYVGMDAGADGGAPTFTYGENFGQNTGVKYAPAVPITTISTTGTYSLADNTITIFVPESGVGSPTAGTTLADLQARTFAGQADATTVSTNLAVDSTGFGTYTLVPDSTCA